MKFFRYLFYVVLALGLQVAGRAAFADCGESHGSTTPSQPTTPPSGNSSGGPSAPSVPPPATHESTTTEQIIGLTLYPSSGGGNKPLLNSGGDNPKKPFGHSDFMQTMRAVINHYIDEDNERKERMENRRLVRQWKNESGWDEKRNNLSKTWDNWRGALDAYYDSKEKVEAVQKDLDKAKKDAEITRRIWGEKSSYNDREKMERGFRDNMMQEKIDGLQQKLDTTIKETHYEERKADKEALDNTLHNAQQEMETADEKMKQLEANWQDTQKADVPKLSQ